MFSERANNCPMHSGCQSPGESCTGQGHSGHHGLWDGGCQGCRGRRFVGVRHGLRARNGERMGWGREGGVILDETPMLRRAERGPASMEILSDRMSGLGAPRQPILPRGRPWPPQGLRGSPYAQSILSDRGFIPDDGYPIPRRYPHSPLMTPPMPSHPLHQPLYRSHHPFLAAELASPRSRAGSIRAAGSGGRRVITPRPRIPEQGVAAHSLMGNYRPPYVEDYDSALSAQEKLEYEAALREEILAGEIRGAGAHWYEPYDDFLYGDDVGDENFDGRYGY